MDASQSPAQPPQAPEAVPEPPQPQDALAAAAEPQQEQQKQDPGSGEGAGEDDEDEDEDEKFFSRAHKLMEKITSSPDNPNPNVLHALSSILETEESRYMEETGHFSLNNARASHNIGRLGNLIRENEEFFDLISYKFLTETRYPIPVPAAAARLLVNCSVTWMFPHIFEDDVLENIKNWAMNETAFDSNFHNLKHDLEGDKSFDSEMLRTYSTGLLAVGLSGGSTVLEDALTSGLAAKLMHFLRSSVLGETSISQKDSSYPVEYKSTSGVSSIKGKEEGRTRVRQVLESTHLDEPRKAAEEPAGDISSRRDHERNNGRFEHEDCWVDGEEQHDVLNMEADSYDVDARVDGRDFHDGKMQLGDIDESARDDLRRKVNRGCLRFNGKGRVNDGLTEKEQIFNIPGSGSRLCTGQSIRDKSHLKNIDIKKTADVAKSLDRDCACGSAIEMEDNDARFPEFNIGSKDISDLIKHAVRAAEAEARAANAPEEATKAAGDAAAEVVKSAALEEFQTTNDEETALLAASRAASTVIDAAAAVEVSRSSNITADSMNSNIMEPEATEAEDFFLPNSESLAQLREKYCIQCLEILGEYVEVLGPVLHEKGVDVCLALLQRGSRNHQASVAAMLLHDVLKLICALAAHRKFAALFVDRGGMQKLLAVPRLAQTFVGLSSCVFTIGSLQGIMERVCALPPEVVYQVVELALQLLMCPQDQARKNAALFFAAAFVFRAVIDSFDSKDGLHKLLCLLHDPASVRSGVTSSGAVDLSTAGSLRNDRSPAEGLTSSEKQIAYHTCVALRQYFRAHLLVLVDSIRPSKNSRSAYRNIPIARTAYKPLDISNEAVDAVLLQLHKDRKLGPAFVKTYWEAVDKFYRYNGHVTMLELCQAPPVERYLHDLLQYALGILHIVTLVPHSRKLIVNATLSNGRVGIAVILDAANCASYVDHEIIQPALNVLVNLVCPPPSISNKPPLLAQSQQASVQSLGSEARERNGESSLGDRSAITAVGRLSIGGNSQALVPAVASGLVGDRRICLGASGLAAQLEQGYRQAREAVRANNGIKVLLHLLQPRIVSPPATLDCLRALACRVLLGLARDDTIAQILTKLQVGKRLSELIRDTGNQAELAHVAIELIGIVTNSGRASTLAATDAATPTLRRIERAAIAAATPITYHSRELLLLIHEHLQASGLASTAAVLVKEAQLTPLPSLATPSLVHQAPAQENSSFLIQWPSGRIPGGFFSNKLEVTAQYEASAAASSKMKPLVFSSTLNCQPRNHPLSHDLLTTAAHGSSNRLSAPAVLPEVPCLSPSSGPSLDIEPQCKTPIILPMKRKQTESKDAGLASSGKRFNTGEHGFRSPGCKNSMPADGTGFSTPRMITREELGRSVPNIGLVDNLDDNQCSNAHACQKTPSQTGFLNDRHPGNTERLNLDSLVVQYLKHQHRQCPAPITTLPPLSLLQPHVCPEPSRSLDAPANVTARLGAREFRLMSGGQRDRHLVYSRFRPWRTCRDEGALLTCLAFLDNSSQVAVGSHSGELRLFDSDSGNVLESCVSHPSSITMVQSFEERATRMILSSSSSDVRLWSGLSIADGPVYDLPGCKSARFCNTGGTFAALPAEQPRPRREILLYDSLTGELEAKLSDTSSNSLGLGRGHAYSHVHFSPSDTMLLWNGVLWDRRSSGPVHRFDQFTDYGGGGFHPAGNEVIINSEVWDLRKFRLLRSVPSLDQTVITFNTQGDVIYAILRRNLEDITSAFHTRRSKHSLYSAFRTVDAVNYSDIATTPVDKCVLDFAAEPTDSFVGLVTMDDQEDMFSSARVYEIGRRRPTDDDSDPDDAESEDEEDEDDEDDEEEVEEDQILGPDFDDGDSDGDDGSNGGDSASVEMDDDEEEDGEGDTGLLQILAERDGEGEDDSDAVESFSSGEDDEDFTGAGFAF